MENSLAPSGVAVNANGFASSTSSMSNTSSSSTDDHVNVSVQSENVTITNPPTPPATIDNSDNSSNSNGSEGSILQSLNFFRRGSADTIESTTTMVGDDVDINDDGSGKGTSLNKAAGKIQEGSTGGEGVEMMVDTADEMDVHAHTTNSDEIENGTGGVAVNGMGMRGERAGGVATYKVVASLICVVAGTGTLGMPHAVAEAGWLGVCIIALSLFMSVTTGNMLIDCLYLKTNARRSSYQEIAHDAYGKAGHYIAFGTVGINLFGCAVLYIILAATLIQTMVNDYGHRSEPVYIYIIGCSLFVWTCLICTKSMKEIAILSIVGAGATLGVVMITIGISADMILHHAAVTVSATHKIVDWAKIPLCIATMSFAYGGNVVYPHVEQSMRYPRSWPKALWSALTICFVMYMAIAVAGYLAFGDDTLSPILKNLPLGTNRQQFLKRAIPRTIIIILTGLIAAVIPYFGDVMDLLGALTTCLLVFVMPILFYYKLGGLKNSDWWVKLWALFIFVIGLVALVLGTINATQHLIEDFKNK
ncbi:hypothetical protein BGZ99_010246 [Dissophora globulifera]|uniref:Amino acid transporter transmembrane domain-containing protein n=1 Tax=Dissophora globulifera TaxID=979702 RepID=A0A9P6RST9_9FUNG|nr:hypothetical protein BGZ99_010246 [Dissophora globulifera]